MFSCVKTEAKKEFSKLAFSISSVTVSPSVVFKSDTKVKSCYNPLRLGTVIVLVASGIDFVNTPRLYSDRATR